MGDGRDFWCLVRYRVAKSPEHGVVVWSKGFRVPAAYPHPEICRVPRPPPPPPHPPSHLLFALLHIKLKKKLTCVVNNMVTVHWESLPVHAHILHVEQTEIPPCGRLYALWFIERIRKRTVNEQSTIQRSSEGLSIHQETTVCT